MEKSFNALAKSYVLEPEFEKSYAWIAKVSQEMKGKGLKPDKDLVTQIKSARATIKTEAKAS